MAKLILGLRSVIAGMLESGADLENSADEIQGGCMWEIGLMLFVLIASTVNAIAKFL